MVTLEALRTEMREEFLRIAAHRGARRVRVFGSVARGEATDSSDLDLLADWDAGRSLREHAQLAEDLEPLLKIKVHVGTDKSLHCYGRERIL